MTHTFTLHPLTEDEIDKARLLCDTCVGENLYSKDEIAAVLGDADRFFYLLKTETEKTVGYIYYYLTDLEYLAGYTKLDIAQYRAICADDCKKVGNIQSVGLLPAYRGSGLAARMIRHALNDLRAHRAEAAFVVCWKPDGTVPLGKVMLECRFSYLAEAKKVWYDDTELICPYCKGRCLCDAEVYYQLLNEEKDHEA